MSHESSGWSPCDGVRSDLVAFLDGELAPERATAIRAHLEGCAACEAERAALDGAWGALDALGGLEPTAGLWDRIEREVLAAPAVAPAAPAAETPRGGQILAFPEPRRSAWAGTWAWAPLAALAAGALLTAGVGFWAVRALSPRDDQGGGQLAVQQPAPSKAPVPDPFRMPASPLPSPEASGSQGSGPKDPGLPPIEVPQRPDSTQPDEPDSSSSPDDPSRGPSRDPSRDPEGVAQLPPGRDPLSGLADEERAVIDNLDLLVALASGEARGEDAELIENLDLLEDLEEEVLDELAG
ncbi:MAG: zf-HC2 domain-containing protein [Planctomycetota bacterium]